MKCTFSELLIFFSFGQFLASPALRHKGRLFRAQWRKEPVVDIHWLKMFGVRILEMPQQSAMGGIGRWRFFAQTERPPSDPDTRQIPERSRFDVALDTSHLPRQENAGARLRVSGKHFRRGSEKVALKGVTYGPFAKRDEDKTGLPESTQMREDLDLVAAMGARASHS